MSAYYNEFKPEAAHMLRQLIRDGLIAPGDVDERSITEVSPDDIRGYTQAHFFAGIGGWSVALRLAGWPDDRPVWTGSCPCQPFSTAGKQKGKADERHLWPVWFRLIRECAPAVVFGEQVASAITHGWWDDVAADMEAEGYSCGAAVLPACSVGKPHRRDRLWFVGDAKHDGPFAREVARSQGQAIQHYTQGKNCARELEGAGEPSNVADADQPRPQGRQLLPERAGQRVAGADGVEWIACPDGKQRPVEPSICLLAHGVRHRAPLLHGYGNAIVPQVAAAFIQASERVRLESVLAANKTITTGVFE